MHNAEDSPDFPSVDVSRTFYTLIPSRFPTIDVFARIANDRSLEIAEIESITNPRLKERKRLLSGAGVVDTHDPLIQNWNHAPFTYSNPDGTRFFGPEQPALELSQDIQTALAVSIGKREAFLARTREEQIALEMRVLTRVVKGRFADGTAWDPTLGQEERRRLGRAVTDAGYDGILFRPVERLSGVCISILRGATLDRAVQGDHFKFVWDGTHVSTLYSFSSGQAYAPEELRGEKIVLAA